ncbi:MAG TPA: sensor domain-containing diguanylate cyclase [Gammaproteobacteria bacterium]|nr:sensor domain-containing diguanylate cyclase [Gammaproteobacteria bacterium]
MPQLSIQQLTLRYSLIVLSIVISLTFVSFISIKSIIDQDYEKKQHESLQIKVKNISNTLRFYRGIIDKLARTAEVVDMIQFGGEDEAQVWAVRMQHLIPDSVGLALFNETGQIFGQKGELHVGDICMVDLKRHLEKKPQIIPPVHDDNPAFPHFDLLSNVSDGEEVIGVVFASFHLAVLQDLLDQLTEKGQHLQLFTGNHNAIIETNRFSDRQSEQDNVLFFVNLPVEGSDWHLIGNIERNQQANVMFFTAFANGVLFLLISLVFLGFSARLVKSFSSDFNIIHLLLTNLRNDEKTTVNTQTKLIETEEIIQGIKVVADDIYAYQEQLLEHSQRDELTGLLNRRGFYLEASRGLDLVQREIETTLVLLDIDYFKQMNDRVGHAAGDQILVILADCINRISRSIDISARLGGDEFVVILVKCPDTYATEWYKKLSDSFKQQQQTLMSLPDEAKLCCLSAGYSAIHSDDADIAQAIARADKALYAAKAAGRDNIQGCYY